LKYNRQVVSKLTEEHYRLLVPLANQGNAAAIENLKKMGVKMTITFE
jgi:hypothetical protein